MSRRLGQRYRGMENTPLYCNNGNGEEEGLIPLFLANREEDNRTPATLRYYRQRLLFYHRWLRENGYEGLLRDFSLDTVNAYVRSMQEKEVKYQHNPFTRPRPGKLSSVYIKNNVRVLKTFAVWLAEFEYTKDDLPAKRKVPKAEEKEIQILQRWEIENILGAIDRKIALGVRDTAIIWTFLDTGIRLSELVSLTMDGIDFRTGYLHVKGKGRKERSVPFGAATKKWLMLYRDRYRPRALSNRFFLNRNGGPLTANSVDQMALKRAPPGEYPSQLASKEAKSGQRRFSLTIFNTLLPLS